jgi:S-adenosylmethionine decarboxylase
MTRPLGMHVLLDLWGVAPALLDDLESLAALLVGAAERGGARVVDARFNKFQPQGVSGVVVIAESHLALHTWPEHGLAAVDVFTCGNPQVAERVAAEVLAALAPQGHELRRVPRSFVPPRGG